MESISDFRRRVADAIAAIDKNILEYDRSEFWMIRLPYEFIEDVAEKKRLFNTAVALPLARGLHDGAHRKSPVYRSGKTYHPPYLIHCLTVCKTLSEIWLPLDRDELDILLASALCHDLIEDIPFQNSGREIYEKFGLDKRVYDTVKLLSKRKDFTLEQEQAHFRGIMENRLSLLVKLSDRGHNVTDLYNMSDRKLREYINETRTYFLPMCDYAREHYPELNEVTEIMQDYLNVLIKSSEILADRHNARRAQLEEELDAVRRENEELQRTLDRLKWEAIAE